MIRDYLEQIVRYEERIAFATVPDEYENLRCQLQDLIGSQAEKLGKIPAYLDQVVETIKSHDEDTTEKSLEFKMCITYDLPPSWLERVTQELERATKQFCKRVYGQS